MDLLEATLKLSKELPFEAKKEVIEDFNYSLIDAQSLVDLEKWNQEYDQIHPEKPVDLKTYNNFMFKKRSRVCHTVNWKNRSRKFILCPTMDGYFAGKSEKYDVLIGFE